MAYTGSKWVESCPGLSNALSHTNCIAIGTWTKIIWPSPATGWSPIYYHLPTFPSPAIFCPAHLQLWITTSIVIGYGAPGYEHFAHFHSVLSMFFYAELQLPVSLVEAHLFLSPWTGAFIEILCTNGQEHDWSLCNSCSLHWILYCFLLLPGITFTVACSFQQPYSSHSESSKLPHSSRSALPISHSGYSLVALWLEQTLFLLLHSIVSNTTTPALNGWNQPWYFPARADYALFAASSFLLSYFAHLWLYLFPVFFAVN